MASILDALSQGFRGMGAVYSPDVYNTQRQEEQNQLNRQSKDKELLLGVLVKARENGSISEEVFQQATQKAGIQGLPNIGPSVATQKAQLEIGKERNLEARRTAFNNPQPSVPNNPDTTAGMAPEIAVRGKQTNFDVYMQRAEEAAKLDLKDEAERYSKLADLELKNREKTSPEGTLLRERDEIAAKNPNDPRLVFYDGILKNKSAPAQKNAQFVEIATGKTINGKPEYQQFQVVGLNPDGTANMKPIGSPAPKGALVDVNMGMSPTDAAKTQLLDGALSDLRSFRDMVAPNGKIDRNMVLGLNAPGFAGLPGTDSRTAYSMIYNAIEAKLRAQSGAAVPELEVTREVARFVPSPLDNDATIKSKMDRLEGFIKGTYVRIKNAGPQNTTPKERVGVDSVSGAEVKKVKTDEPVLKWEELK